MKKKKDTSLYDQLRTRAILKKAWVKIRRNSLSKHASRTTRNLAQTFAETEDRELERMQEQLRKREFVFPPARGVAIPKPGKTAKRPLLVFSIESRIVQRAILEIVKDLAPVEATLKSKFNYGGIEGKEFGVPGAIQAVIDARPNYSYFIRSDIKAFFDSVTRDRAIQCLTKHISDKDLLTLIESATNIELANRSALGEDIKYFPSEDHGLAQGSCLSPLLCNLVLEEFDVRMNSHGVRCIRYVDDFVILARDRRQARAALQAGTKVLESLNLSAYDPQTHPKKAEEGLLSVPWTFLGCEFVGTEVRPSLDNRRSLLRKVDTLLKMGTSLTSTLGDASQTVLGWGNTFGFCSDEHAFGNLDRELHSRIKSWIYIHLHKTKEFTAPEWLQKAGVQPLEIRKRPRVETARYSSSNAT